jgi:hypothetical protein
MRTLGLFSCLIILVFAFYNCSDSSKSINSSSDCEKIKQDFIDLQSRYTDLYENFNKLSSTSNDVKPDNINSLLGLWSTSWPVGSGISQGYIFNNDGSFNYINDFWIKFDISKESFPITYFLGTTGEWKIDSNKFYIKPKYDIYENFQSAEEYPSGYYPNDPTYKFNISKYTDWQLIADIRSFHGRWVKSEDDYPAGEYIYPLGDPDIETIAFLVINNGNISEKAILHILFGTIDQDFIDQQNELFRSIVLNKN